MNMIKKLLIFITLTVTSLPAMVMDPSLRVDANGYKYKDENTVQDKRRIAVLSYGSLVKQPENQTTRARLMTASAFAPTAVALPVSLSRLSQGNRLTAVIDNQGEPKSVWAAQSAFQFLPNARNNLAAREGAPYKGQDAGYDLKNIFYMKKLLSGRSADSNEEEIDGTRWVIRVEENSRQKIASNIAQAIANWADKNEYSAVIWASFAPNIGSKSEIVQKLLGDDELLRNTQAYIQNLPNGAQTGFENAIMAGADAIRKFAGGQAPSSTPQAYVPRQLSNEEKAALAAEWNKLASQRYFRTSLSPRFVFFDALYVPTNKEPLNLFTDYSNWISSSYPDLQQQAYQKASELVKHYKIHLMPQPSVDPSTIVKILLDAYAKDEELKKLSQTFKIAQEPLPLSQGQVMPQVVIYSDWGKEATQELLNRIYRLFSAHPEIKGSGVRPRFNVKVNDLIWVAQGNGDFKGEGYEKYYELPLKAYYRSNITGAEQNYHLKHPETGKELVD